MYDSDEELFGPLNQANINNIHRTPFSDRFSDINSIRGGDVRLFRESDTNGSTLHQQNQQQMPLDIRQSNISSNLFDVPEISDIESVPDREGDNKSVSDLGFKTAGEGGNSDDQVWRVDKRRRDTEVRDQGSS
jgi:hypothetical protein